MILLRIVRRAINRWMLLVLLASVVMPLNAASPAIAPPLGDMALSDFYLYKGAHPGKAGVLLRQEPLAKHQSLMRAGENLRLLYSSKDGLFGEQDIVVSGALYLPKGDAPKGGWPLIAWAHGTVGIADACAPSWNGRRDRDNTYLNFWLANGYAVVASDYQGLGTPGTHPYLATRPAAYSNIDIIRAVQNANFPVSKSVVIIGQSQGAGAALATVGYAPQYGPEIDVRGAVLTGAPYFSAEGLAAVQASRPKDVVDPMLAYNFLALSMLGLINPEFRLEDYVRPSALVVAKAVNDTCYGDLRDKVDAAALTYNKAFKKSPGAVLQAAFKRMEYATLKLDVPVFMGISGKDLSTPVRMQMALKKSLCAAGTTVESHFYPRATHGSVVNGSTNDSSVFVEKVFAGQKIQARCE